MELVIPSAVVESGDLAQSEISRDPSTPLCSAQG